MSDEPLVTIVVTYRERFSSTSRCLDHLIAHTDVPYKLVYVSSGAPAYVHGHVEEVCAKHGFELVSSADLLPPNAARNAGLAAVKTRYVLFLDNDVIVTPGWLNALLDCAEETNYEVVGPTVLEGDPAHGIVHTMGGEFRKRKDASGRRWLDELHRFDNVDLHLNPSTLERSQADHLELHCLLARREIFDKTGPFDERVLAASEHIDFAHTLRRHGFAS
jgi:glycosyltransferase involved in cell wall biosynthesis